MKQRAALLMLLFALCAGGASAAPLWHTAQRQGNERSSGITLDQAAERVRRESGGRILSAETVVRDGQRIHRIKLLTPDHRVVVREVNADHR